MSEKKNTTKDGHSWNIEVGVNDKNVDSRKTSLSTLQIKNTMHEGKSKTIIGLSA